MTAIAEMLRRVSSLERMTEDVSGKRCTAGGARTRAAAMIGVVVAWRLLGWTPRSQLIRCLRASGATITPAWLTSAGYSLVTVENDGMGPGRPRQLLDQWTALRADIGHREALDAMTEIEALMIAEGAPSR